MTYGTWLWRFDWRFGLQFWDHGAGIERLVSGLKWSKIQNLKLITRFWGLIAWLIWTKMNEIKTIGLKCN